MVKPSLCMSVTKDPKINAVNFGGGGEQNQLSVLGSLNQLLNVAWKLNLLGSRDTHLRAMGQ